MAHENINIQYPNFCLGPQLGTICTIDTTNLTTVLRIKNMAGGLIVDYTLSSNIINELVGVEYVGPSDLSEIIDGLTFFTVEKINTSKCIIKRWETRTTYSQLYLKEQIIKTSTGNDYYDIIAFAIEYYNRALIVANAGNSGPVQSALCIELNSVDNIGPGTRLLMGPSTDYDNVGATEVVYVSSVVAYSEGYRVNLTSPVQNQYIIGDPVHFYSNFYLCSSVGYAGEVTKGTIYKFDAYSWNKIQADSKNIYKRVTAAKWCPFVQGIATIVNTNILFIRPYDSYSNWRSLFLKNYKDDKITMFNVYDIIFKGYSFYKLQEMVTIRYDGGGAQTFTWDNYNYQEDTLLPYTDSINMWMSRSVLIGYLQSETINIQVRDQYNVGLRAVNINLYIDSGDTIGASFDPSNGYGITDINGKLTINYSSGTVYEGHTVIKGKADKSSTSTGSELVWTSNNFISKLSYNEGTSLFTEVEVEGENSLRVFGLWFEEYRGWKRGTGLPVGKVDPDWFKPDVWLVLKSIFISPHKDVSDDAMVNKVTVVEEFEGNGSLTVLTNFLIRDNILPYTLITLPSEYGQLQISQLKLSKHTHYVDGVVYDYLWTYANIDQFIFVEDAVPKFWSEKNPIVTNIWIRLRPFMYSLDNDSLKMWVREVSYIGDTGYYEVSDKVSLENFDAGGGLLGVEVTYDPIYDFHHNALVFVRIEVYDIAPISNYISLDYWFTIIPDLKSTYLTNLFPAREEDFVNTNINITFEIHDEGTGVDINTLECFLNSRRMNPDNLIIEKYNKNYYKVTYIMVNPLYYGKKYKVNVKITDSSEAANQMNDSWYFYTLESDGVIFTQFDPSLCKRGVDRFSGVSIVALADGGGIDGESIRLQVLNKDVDANKIPIVYRVS